MNKIIREKQKRKSTDVRKREIIDVAIRILAIDGARAFTAKNIATEVGVTSGAIFRHFVNMETIVGDTIAMIETTLTGDFPVGVEDPIKRLKVFFLNRTKTILAHPDITRLLLSDHLDQAAGHDAARSLAKAKIRSRKFVLECLQEAEQTGSLGNGVDAEVAMVIVIGAILSMSHATTRVANKTKSSKLYEDVWFVIERMLKTDCSSNG